MTADIALELDPGAPVYMVRIANGLSIRKARLIHVNFSNMTAEVCYRAGWFKRLVRESVPLSSLVTKEQMMYLRREGTSTLKQIQKMKGKHHG